MMSDTRSILYLRPPVVDDWLATAMQRRGWDVHVATHPDMAREVLRDKAFHVGLVHWDAHEFEAEMRNEAEFLIEGDRNVNWVALLSRAAETFCDVARMISTHFYDYHTLPVDADRLLMTLGHAYGMAEMRKCIADPISDLSSQHEMVGNSPAMRSLYQKISKVAAIDMSVMIRGESGTGKELTAQAIHRLSDRAKGSFIAVNCGALPRDLIQAELFGHEKGAFTGADRLRVGRIEAAQNGTLFLDEIGDLPIDMQTNLLRFLQEKTITRVGSPTQIPVDVRVIAATHVDLEKAVEEGRFREDLYYRLNVLHLEMPALRDRGDDIELLADHLFHQVAATLRPSVKGFSKRALGALMHHSWPGNVREMFNRIQRAVVMSEGRLISPQDLGLDQFVPSPMQMTLSQARARAEKELIEMTLSEVRNNVSRAARLLDISRVTLYRLMEQHEINWQKGE